MFHIPFSAPEDSLRFQALRMVIDGEMDPKLTTPLYVLMLLQSLEQSASLDAAVYAYSVRRIACRRGGAKEIVASEIPDIELTVPLGLGLMERDLAAIVRLARPRRALGRPEPPKPIAEIWVRGAPSDLRPRLSMLRTVLGEQSSGVVQRGIASLVPRLSPADLRRYDRLVGAKSPGQASPIRKTT